MSSSFYKEKWEDSRKVGVEELDFRAVLGYVIAHVTKALLSNLVKLNDLTSFCATLFSIPSPPRPNCTLKYSVFNDLDSSLIKSRSLFVYITWATLLEKYPGELPKLIDGIIIYRCKIGFIRHHNRHVSKNLSIALLDAPKITATLLEDLKLKQVL
jgi:hypothetical protein